MYRRYDDIIIYDKNIYEYNNENKKWELKNEKKTRITTYKNITDIHNERKKRYITFTDNNLLFDKKLRKLRKIKKEDYILYKNNIKLDLNNNEAFYFQHKIFNHLFKPTISIKNDRKNITRFIYRIISEENPKLLLFFDMEGIFIKNIFLQLFEYMYFTEHDTKNENLDKILKIYVINEYDNIQQYKLIISDIKDKNRNYSIIIFNNTNMSLNNQYNIYNSYIKDNGLDKKNLVTFKKQCNIGNMDKIPNNEFIKTCIYNQVIKYYTKKTHKNHK